MAKNNTKNFTSFPLEKSESFTECPNNFSILMSIFKEIFFTQTVWFNYIFKRSTFFFSYFKKMCGAIFQEHTKENKRFQPSFGEVKEAGKFIKLFFPSLLDETFYWF